jgi:peptide/nickel transport system permease protein
MSSVETVESPETIGTVPLTPRSLVRARRVDAVRGFGSAFRRDPLAIAGLVVLVAFIAVALLAPVVSPTAGLSAVDSMVNPVWERPSGAYPFGTDNLGRSVAAQFV